MRLWALMSPSSRSTDDHHFVKSTSCQNNNNSDDDDDDDGDDDDDDDNRSKITFLPDPAHKSGQTEQLTTKVFQMSLHS